MDSEKNLKKEFKTEYVYQLRQSYKIYLGAFREKSGSMGFIGDIGPLFYSNHYLSQISHYWMGSYYSNSLVDKGYVWLDFVFDDYNNTKTVKEKMGYNIGKIEGEGSSYSSQGGLVLGNKAKVEVPSDQFPIYGFVKTFCFFFVFKYKEDLPEKYYLVKRGRLAEPSSLAISLIKDKKGKRTVNLEVWSKERKTNGTIIHHVFKTKRKLNATSYNELQVCFSTGQDFISSGLSYLNGHVDYFQKLNETVFNWMVFKNDLVLADNDQGEFDGNINLLIFRIIEGAGNAIWSQERDVKVSRLYLYL